MAHGKFKTNQVLLVQAIKMARRRGVSDTVIGEALFGDKALSMDRCFAPIDPEQFRAEEAASAKMRLHHKREQLMQKIWAKQVYMELVAAFRTAVLAVTEDGHYMEICAGMDCDAVQFRYCVRRETPQRWADWVALYERTYDINRYDCDPAIWFGRPSEYIEERVTRDRAMEAYEDGHPWSVMLGAL